MLSLFVNNLLPVLLCAGVGFVIGRRFKPDVTSITRLVFYAFSPALVFHQLLNAELSGDALGQMVGFAAACLGLQAGLAALAGWALRLERRAWATLIVTAVFVNGGNVGLATVRFAFGDAALPFAVAFFVTSTFATYTFGVLVASLGKRNLRSALGELLTVPAFYGLIAAEGLRMTGLTLPLPLARAIELLSEATIPVMLVVLGMQIERSGTAQALSRQQWAVVAAASGSQLLVAPVLAFGLASVLGLNGPALQAGVLQASMPAAVITTVLAGQYDLDLDVATRVVVVTTLLSPLVLTPVMTLLV
jgi:predicted permease